MRKTVIVSALIVSLICSGCQTGIEQQLKVLKHQNLQMSLVKKAEYFEEDLKEHISPEGLCWYRLSKRGDRYFVACSALSDAAYMTGCLLGAEALRYEVTGSEDAKEKLIKLANGLHILQEITGRKGYFARAFCKKCKEEVWAESWFEGKDKYEEYIWRGNTSKDQYTPVMFGYFLAYEAVKDKPEMQEIRDQISEDVSNIADFLIDNKYKIIGEQGITKDGNLSPRILGIPIMGLDALHCLTWIKIAEVITGRERFKKAYDDLVREGLPGIVACPLSFYDRPWPFRETDYVNNNMAFLDFYAILRIANNEEKYYQRGLQNRFFWKKIVKYPFWNFAYAAFCQSNKSKEKAVKEGVESLTKFTLKPGRFWGIEEREEVKYAGSAFLLAYWVGRNHGFISANQ